MSHIPPDTHHRLESPEPLALGSSAGLGAGAGAHGMTNAELAAAIEAAWQLQQRTYNGSATYQDICDHLRDLLRTQQARACVMPPAWPAPSPTLAAAPISSDVQRLTLV